MTVSADKNQWPPVLRTLHLPGGLRVDETEPGKARFGPIGVGAGAITVSLTSYAAIGNDQRKITCLPVLGCEIFRTLREVDGLAQPEWRPIVPNHANRWPTKEAERSWSGLCNAARLKGDMRTFLIAGAITSQCRFAAMRLLDLSNLYLKNLYAFLRDNKIKQKMYYLEVIFQTHYLQLFMQRSQRYQH